MKNQTRRAKGNGAAAAAMAAVALAAAGYAGITNFLLFHVIAEGITVAIAFAVVLIALNNYRHLRDGPVPILGIAYAFAGCFDVAHILTYNGMGIFPDAGSDLPAQLSIIARYLDSTGMLVAGLSFAIGCQPARVLANYAALSAVAALALYLGDFPAAFVDGQGPTPFAVCSGYAVCIILAAGAALMMRHRDRLRPVVYRQLLAFFLFSGAAEFLLTWDKVICGWEGVAGHLLKAAAFFFLYRAVVATSLREPYELLDERTRALNKSSRRLTEILSSISDGFFVLDNDWRVVYVNPAAAGHGLQVEGQAADKNVFALYPDMQPYREQFIRAKRENAAVHFEAASPGKGGWLEVHAYPSPEGLSVYFRDISEHKRYEAELARLDRLNMVGELAAGIGHEIRNPLTTVRGYLQLFQKREKYAEHREQFATMIEELDRANTIISEYLALARTRVAAPVRGNLNGVLKALYPLLQADALRAGHTLEVAMGDIPVGYIDERELRQLVLNLARNGLEAMQAGGKLTIRTYRDNNGEVVLSVSDTGTGIPRQVLDRLGTPFLTTKENGTGLGLAVCYRIAARHGARIEVDTSPAGTTFTLRFMVGDTVDCETETAPAN